MALRTADGLFMYDAETNGGVTLMDHANRLNAYLAIQNGWPVNGTLCRGQWGLDINVWRIGYAVLMTTETDDIENIAKHVHDGWAMCFSYWFRNKPWLTDSSYNSPGKSLITKNKEHRAKTPYNKLDDEQKKICRQVATYLLKYYC